MKAFGTHPPQIRSRVAYVLGDVGFNASWVLFDTYLIYVYAQAPATRGALLSATVFAARLSALLSGFAITPLLDRFHSRWGRYRPVLAGGGLLASVALGLLYALPQLAGGLSSAQRLLLAIAGGLVYGASYIGANIAYTALLSVITAHADERIRLSAARFFGAGVAVTAVHATAIPVATRLGHGDSLAGWSHLALLFGAVSCVLLLLCAAGCRKVVPQTLRAPVAPARMLMHRDVYCLVIAIAASTAGFTIRGVVLPFYVSFNAGHVVWTGNVLASGSLAAALVCGGFMLIPRGRASPQALARGATLGGLLLSLLFAGINSKSERALVAEQLVFGLATGLVTAALFAAVAQVEYSRRPAGSAPSAGLAFLALLGLKVGALVASVGFTVLLGVAHFDAQHVSPQVLPLFKACYTVIPAVCFAITAYVLRPSSADSASVDSVVLAEAS